ncbi:MAG TPA: glycosyltransferase family 39 protein [Acidimicrobiales bacterium]|nr:glycosyltransferase family 39 protein [Acidimicrobiales bacterium]
MTAVSSGTQRRAAVQVAARQWREVLPLAAMVVGAALLRLPLLHTGYWIDEGISVGIASHHLVHVPSLLRLDGSPPLYYLILHVWMRLFGTSEVSTHILSLIPSLATIPVMWWAARLLFGIEAARYAAALAVVSPFLTQYAAETRMYSMVALVSLVVVTCFVKAVALDDRRYWSGVVVASVALVYLHNWGLFVVIGIGMTGLALGWVRESPRMRRDTLLCCGTVGLCYVPWLPSFVFQATHTGAPWAGRPNPVEIPVNIGGAIGGGLAVFVIAIMVVTARRSRGAVRTQDARWRLSMAVIATLTVVTLAVAVVAAELVPSWDERYLAIVVCPVLMLVAAVLSRTRSGRIALTVSAALMVLPTIGLLSGPAPAIRWSKSNVGLLAQKMSVNMHPGDLVVSAQITQIPVLSHYLPRGVVYADPLGLTFDPTVVNWQDLPARLQLADPNELLKPLIDALGVGAQVLLVDPVGWSVSAPPSTYSGLLSDRAIAVNRLVLGDLDLRAVETVAVPHPRPGTPVTGILLVKQ